MILIVTLKNLLMIAVISMTLHRFLSVFSMLRDDLTYSACILTLIFSDHITQVHFKADRTNSSSVNASNTISSQQLKHQNTTLKYYFQDVGHNLSQQFRSKKFVIKKSSQQILPYYIVMNKQSVTLKLLIVGDSGVGKTSLLMRYTENKFHTDFLSTIGVDFKVKKIQTQTHHVTLNIWDTAGQQRFRNITKTFYKGAHGVILVYSITDNKSFQHLASWIHQVKDNGSEKANMILVGSKSDMQNQRQVTQKLGKQIAAKFNLEFIETSAKDNENIDRVFSHLVKNIITQMKEGQGMNNNSQKIKGKKLKKSKQQKKSKEKCC